MHFPLHLVEVFVMKFHLILYKALCGIEFKHDTSEQTVVDLHVVSDAYSLVCICFENPFRIP
jgi:hypothetical protein